MIIGFGYVVWISEKENIFVPSTKTRYTHQMYCVHQKVLYYHTYIKEYVKSFDKQSDAINFACKMIDRPIEIC